MQGQDTSIGGKEVKYNHCKQQRLVSCGGNNHSRRAYHSDGECTDLTLYSAGSFRSCSKIGSQAESRMFAWNLIASSETCNKAQECIVWETRAQTVSRDIMNSNNPRERVHWNASIAAPADVDLDGQES